MFVSLEVVFRKQRDPKKRSVHLSFMIIIFEMFSRCKN